MAKNSPKDQQKTPSESSPLLGQSTNINLPTHTDDFSHLPPHEAELLRAQIVVKPVKASFWSMYRYASRSDRYILAVGFIASVVSGALRPLMTILVGNVAQLFVTYRPCMNTDGTACYNDYGNSTYGNSTYGNYTSYENSTYGFNELVYNDMPENISPDEFQRTINQIAFFFIMLAVTDFIASSIATFVFIDRGEVLSSRIRSHYLESTLRQNIAYFDKLGTGEITSRISGDTLLVQEGMSEKVSLAVSSMTNFIAAMVVAFFRSWKLSFILLGIIVSVVVTMSVCSRYMVRFYRRSLAGYSVGGTLAEETLASVRNVQAFAIEERLALQYDQFLSVSELWAHRAGMILGLTTALIWFFMHCNYALAFFQGSRYIASHYLEVKQVMSTLMVIMMGAFWLSHIPPHLRYIANGMAAASKLFTSIDRVSAIDPFVEGKKFPSEELVGKVEFQDVKFIYPSRPQSVVLEHFNLTIEAGQTVALVGFSGSGKSTIIGILERFYTPVGGHVYLDGHDINELSVSFLREQIALVSQEPVLFACSVFENIAYGLVGTRYEHVSDVEKETLVRDACRQVNALDFIERLPKGLDTHVGERGFLLSGGQKQRIAIARAIVSNPKILLLDEATSALDTKSEGVVQQALDSASKNRTTIVVAHRLSTIKDADKIIVMSKGKIMESGTHNELLEKEGEYYSLVQAQKIEAAKEVVVDDNQTDSYDSESDDANSSTAYDTSSYEEKEDEKHGLNLTRTKTGHSISSVILRQKPEPKEKKEESTFALIKFLTSLTKGSNHFLLIGSITAVINGFGHPAIAILYALCLQAFRDGPDDYDVMLAKIRVYALIFFLIGILQLTAYFICNASLSLVGQRLIRRIRFLTFRYFLRQDMTFFDVKENSTGRLTALLSQDALAVESLSGATLGQILNALSNVVSGSVLALIVAPRMSWVFVACFPLMIGTGYGRFSLLASVQAQAKKMSENSSAYACEAVSTVRTVATLTMEKKIIDEYHTDLVRQGRKMRASSLKSSILYGTAQSTQFIVMGLGFWWGSRFVKSGVYQPFNFYAAYMSSIFAGQNAGVAFSYAAEMGKAKSAAISIKNLFDRKPEIDRWEDAGAEIDSEKVQGEIEFKDVHFRYPTRPAVPVLRGLNLKVRKGEYIALVGASGCGKSTTISLIEEFYRPLSGTILFDGKDVNSLNIGSYRSHIALVQQEPVLYAMTIKENILLGSLENAEDVSDERIINACRQCNIHDFISSLPDGYDTMCGTKGVLLSGGQKQRIAIARALIRDPKVLLLDEATSALDSESEKIVQAALDQAAKGRTTIAVAHRLSTIQNADRIYVFDAGRIVESGTHSELLSLKGRYYELVQAQALEKTE
ncbi:ABC multidrug transporter Mdr1 [Myxozyma melibiosi]|uniref:ABC multidrug transporter Mdr1 n=1 Tax=Myxozyma melibiosi TaxID=54550 RepID=A0ABR1F2N7_9ASCO